MKRTFSTSGTLGDTYTMVIKLYDLAKKANIDVYHHTNDYNWQLQIQELYSLLPNITVNFVDKPDTKRSLLNPNFVKKDEADLDHTPFPKYNLTLNPHLIECTESGLDFVCVSPRSGKNGEDLMIPEEHLSCIYQYNKTLYVGMDTTISTTYCDLNMLGTSNLKHSLAMITQCKEFHGYQGLCCFFALSQRIPTNIYYKDANERDAVMTRLHPEWLQYVKGIIKI